MSTIENVNHIFFTQSFFHFDTRIEKYFSIMKQTQKLYYCIVSINLSEIIIIRERKMYMKIYREILIYFYRGPIYVYIYNNIR